MKKIKIVLVAIAAAFFVGVNTQANAATRDQGPDWSKFQGNYGVSGYQSDKFVISQIGGTYGGTLIDQLTYNSQVSYAKSQGLRVHSYLWYGVGGSKTIGKNALDYYLPRIKTPKKSIVALDYEDGASANKQANTDAIIYGMDKVKKAGYTPMYYSYKPYTQQHVYYNQILAKYPNSLWIAAYPDYNVRSMPYYGTFPSMDGIAIWQFTSMYRYGGLDGNVDLTGITKNGYGKNSNTDTNNSNDNSTSPKNENTEYMQRGIFKANKKIAIHTGVKASSKVVGHYEKGETVIYDKIFIRSTGYVWARYKSYSGAYHYICIGENGGKSYGTRTMF